MRSDLDHAPVALAADREARERTLAEFRASASRIRSTAPITRRPSGTMLPETVRRCRACGTRLSPLGRASPTSNTGVSGRSTRRRVHSRPARRRERIAGPRCRPGSNDRPAPDRAPGRFRSTCSSRSSGSRRRARGAFRGPRSSTASRVAGPHRLATVVAPAGYGKTTVLAQWAGRDARPFTWISVDERDDDPIVLLRHVAAALHRLLPLGAAALELLCAPRGSVWTTAVPRLAAVLAARGVACVLVLDGVSG